MRYKVEQSDYPPDPLISLAEAKQHCRIDGTADDAYVTGLITAAVANAEQQMQCSLLTRTITASFAAGEDLCLLRGPIQSITSVSVAGNVVASNLYTIESHGTVDYLRLNGGTKAFYLTIVEYVAGFGDTAADVPADIVQVVKCVVAMLYESRELVTDRTFTPVPFIADFFKLHSREPGVG